ncbi:MAG: GWxTD domain-containing protein [Candidatus Aminicenantales bacterium]
MRPALHWAVVIFLWALFPACSARTEAAKSLDAQTLKFLSEVRYLISKEERQDFLWLPPAERARFIKEFWKQRDLSPETEENEFKHEYYQRIEEANRLFTEGGTPGWLQDRGRVYILIGAPDQREAYPRGRTFYDVPREVWYYGFFPIVFVDSYWSGNYRLDPLSAQHLAEINKTQVGFRPRIARRGGPPNVLKLALKMHKTPDERHLLRVEVPFRDIAFTANGEKLESTLELSLSVLDGSRKKVWGYQRRYPIVLTRKQMAGKSTREYVIEIPLLLEKGDYDLVVELTNSADGSKRQGNISLHI